MNASLKVGLTFLLPFSLLALGHAQTEDVNVLQTNIHRDIGSNGPNSGGSYLAQEVNYLKPDVWNIEELGGNNSGWSVASETTALETYISNNITVFGAHPVEGVNYWVYVGSYTDGYIGNAIVSRFPITFSASYSDGLRGLDQANVTLSNGATLADFVTHMKATTSTNDVVSDSESRQNEANSDATNLRTWMTNHPGTATVFTGDLNEDEDPNDAYNYLAGTTLPNNQVYHPVSTILGSGLTDPLPLSANGKKQTIKSGTTNPSARFDYNFYSNNGAISEVGGTVFNTLDYTSNQLAAMNASAGTSLTSVTSQDASDHLPVMVTYAVTPAPEPVTVLGFLAFSALAVRRRRRS